MPLFTLKSKYLIKHCQPQRNQKKNVKLYTNQNVKYLYVLILHSF